jgi:hypothetical protein
LLACFVWCLRFLLLFCLCFVFLTARDDQGLCMGPLRFSFFCTILS